MIFRPKSKPRRPSEAEQQRRLEEYFKYLGECSRAEKMPSWISYEFSPEFEFKARQAFKGCKKTVEAMRLRRNLDYLQDQEYITRPDGSIVKKPKPVQPENQTPELFEKLDYKTWITPKPDDVDSIMRTIRELHEKIAREQVIVPPAPAPKEVKALPPPAAEPDLEKIFKVKKILCPQCWTDCAGSG